MLGTSKITRTVKRHGSWRALFMILALALGIAVASSAAAGAAAPRATGTNVIQNGDFTTGGAPAADWTQVDVTDDPAGCDPGPAGTTAGGGAINCNGPYVYIQQATGCDPLASGTPFLQEDVPLTSDAYVEQTVTVPADAELTFETWGNYQESAGIVSVVSASGQVTQLASITEPLVQSTGGCSDAAVAQGSIDMSQYAGQTVTLRFEGIASPNSNYDGVYANWDDIALTGDTSTTTTTTATTTSTPTTTTTGTTPTTTTTTPGKRASATAVICDAFNPETPTEYFQCTATVGDASGNAVALRPSGTVTFSVNPGAGGGFQGTQCQLQASESGPTSYCAVKYLPPSSGLLAGLQPGITAAYGGDTTFDPSSGQPQSGAPLTDEQITALESEAQTLAGETNPAQDPSYPSQTAADADGTTSGADSGLPSSDGATSSYGTQQETQDVEQQGDDVQTQDNQSEQQFDQIGATPSFRVPHATATTLGSVVKPVAIKLILPAGSSKAAVALRHLLTAEATLRSESAAASTTFARAKAADGAKQWTDAQLQWTALAKYNAATATALKALNSDYQTLTDLLITALQHRSPSSAQITATLTALAHPATALVTDASRLGGASLLKGLEQTAKASKHGTAKATLGWLSAGRAGSAKATKSLLARLTSTVKLDRSFAALL